VEDERRKAEEAAKAAEEENLSAKELLAKRDKEWEERFQTAEQSWEERLNSIQQGYEQERALLEKDKQFASLQAYTQQRLSEESDNIAPQLFDYINGSTQEEIEQSIEHAKAKSLEIAADAQRAFQAARSQQRGVSATGYAPVGPLEVEGGTRTYSPEDIAAMDMQSYAKLRGQLPGVTNGANGNRGLFG
jgi:hypothetical protein